jgi:hypothetical protein
MKEEKALTVLRALREAVFNDTPKRVAYRLGIPLYQLYLMLSEDSLRKRRPKFPAVYIPYLVEVVGDAPIEAICEACGGVFLRLPKETTRSKEVIEELSLLLRLTADLLDKVGVALNDGVLVPAEYTQLEKLVNKLVKELVELKVILKAFMEEGHAIGI